MMKQHEKRSRWDTDATNQNTKDIINMFRLLDKEGIHMDIPYGTDRKIVQSIHEHAQKEHTRNTTHRNKQLR